MIARLRLLWQELLGWAVGAAVLAYVLVLTTLAIAAVALCVMFPTVAFWVVGALLALYVGRQLL
jgi:hypothetical protein